jgi:nucleotide-binding universal stress UspA family protein
MTDTVVLVSVDGSKDALGALPVAKRLAELRGVPLEVRTIPPAEASLARAGLIVMGASSAGPAGAIGEATLAVLRAAHCPVVLVGPTPGDWALRRVLALHDGSPTVSDALRPAAELARAAGAELIVLQVAGGECAQEAGSIAPPVYLDQIQHSWPAWSREFLHRLASLCPLADIPVRLRVEHGELADETVRVASEESADLIVLAWAAPWNDAGALQALLRAAPCPVMVTREYSVRTSKA